MRTLMPTSLVALRQEMDRLFDRIWDQDVRDLPLLGDWAPPLEVIEYKDLVTVRLDIPGMDPKDVHISFRDSELTVRGEKNYETARTEGTYHVKEREFGSFTRIVRLPASVDASKAKATFHQGVLTIEMIKVPSAKTLEIPVAIG